MASHLGIGLYDFTDRFCDVLENRQLVLKQHSDEVCVFLEGERCAVYAARPAQCRDFPIGWNTKRAKDYCRGLRGLKGG